MIMDIKTQKIVSNEVLTALRMIDSDAIIAGGAPRNWKEDKLANDIDCYLRWKHPRTIAQMGTAIEKLLGNEITISRVIIATGYSWGGDTFSITKLFDFDYKGVRFQLIIVQENTTRKFSESILSHMDMGLNMIGWNGLTPHPFLLVDNFILTNSHNEDYVNKTLTLFPEIMSEAQLKHCMSYHLPEMIKYYPEYKLVLKSNPDPKQAGDEFFNNFAAEVGLFQ